MQTYSVPDLQFNIGVTSSDHLSSELHSNCHFVLLPEAAIDELQQQA